MPEAHDSLVEVPSHFDSSAARLALLSTYQFDPDYFEHVLLRRSALVAARRLAVVIDDRAYADLVRSGAPARHINRRYLMVPVDRSPYVFHPKLALLLGEEGGRVVCGSHNLTRAGCAGNLELTNCVPFDNRIGSDLLDVARGAYRFFRSAAGQAEPGSGRIVSEWLDEAAAEWPWLIDEPSSRGAAVRLVQSYDGPLWSMLLDELRESAPERLLVVSPFYDRDAALLRRLTAEFPTADVELIVQQNVTTLPQGALGRLGGRVRLSELMLSGGARRLHAKLVLWASSTTAGALVGSANLTVAAFDGHNAEACLLLRGVDPDQMFGHGVERRPLRLEEFTPGEEDPEPDEHSGHPLRLESVVLSGDALRVAFARMSLTGHMRIELRAPGDPKPSVVRTLKKLDDRSGVAEVPDGALAGHGPLLAQLVISIDGEEHATPAIWVIDESRLTHESDGSDGRSRQKRVERTGEELVELLDELGERSGAAAVADCLRRSFTGPHHTGRIHQKILAILPRAARLRGGVTTEWVDQPLAESNISWPSFSVSIASRAVLPSSSAYSV